MIFIFAKKLHGWAWSKNFRPKIQMKMATIRFMNAVSQAQHKRRLEWKNGFQTLFLELLDKHMKHMYNSHHPTSTVNLSPRRVGNHYLSQPTSQWRSIVTFIQFNNFIVPSDFLFVCFALWSLLSWIAKLSINECIFLSFNLWIKKTKLASMWMYSMKGIVALMYYWSQNNNI